VSFVRSSLVLGAALLAASCAAPPVSTSTVPAPGATPTPLPMARDNPNIIEEDEFHFVERFPKENYIKVDDRHIRHPMIGPAVEFYGEDDKYYYVYTAKRNEATLALERELTKAAAALTPAAPASASTPELTPTPAGPPLSDFENISPPREAGRMRLEAVSSTGLPDSGLWRHSFVVADINGDGIPDIIAPPSRLGDAKLHVWIGNGKGSFSAWPMVFLEDGKPNPSFSLDYGAVAVGDIDHDGRLDIVAASHSGGLVSLFNEGNGTFRVVRTGLPGREWSSQAIVLADANGDGRLDIIASADTLTGRSDSQDQIRVYVNRGDRWQYLEGGIAGGLYSNSLHAWDFDRDGKADILTGSHFIGGLTLLWKNLGNGKFDPVRFPETEIYAYHFATEPGTFGRERASAFADSYQMATNKPQDARASGITIYSFENGRWARHRVWRQKSGLTSQYALAFGDLDGDGLDDIVFADSEVNRLRVFFQKPDGSFVEMGEAEEPALDSVGQCIRLADVNGDGRLDVILAKTVASYRPGERGGWNVYLNRR
jgi:FG-GAP-like repeat